MPNILSGSNSHRYAASVRVPSINSSHCTNSKFYKLVITIHIATIEMHENLREVYGRFVKIVTQNRVVTEFWTIFYTLKALSTINIFF